MVTEEFVLAFPRELLDSLGCFQGLCLEPAAYIEQILSKQSSRFLARSSAEQDVRYKQVIPYVLIRDGHRWLYYVRGKTTGEKRLVSKGSIGVGGHINPADESLFDTGLDFYERAVQRELHEELKMEAEFGTRIVAVLNDDSSAVGQVHFGIVHLCELDRTDISKGEASLTELDFLTVDELRARRENLESWSQYCLDQIERLCFDCSDRGLRAKARQR